MGGVILLFIVVVLVTILVLPALRSRARRDDLAPPAPTDDTQTHEVIVPQLDDFSKKKSGDDAKRW
jgi:hypothetical protein